MSWSGEFCRLLPQSSGSLAGLSRGRKVAPGQRGAQWQQVAGMDTGRTLKSVFQPLTAGGLSLACRRAATLPISQAPGGTSLVQGGEAALFCLHPACTGAGTLSGCRISASAQKISNQGK